MTIGNEDVTHQPAGVVVVEVHEGANAVRLAQLGPLRGVDEVLGEEHAVADVVGAAAPLPAVRAVEALAGAVARAVGEVAGRAAVRDGVHHASARHRVDECRLLASCNTNQPLEPLPKN